jgi:hypothetical protein
MRNVQSLKENWEPAAAVGLDNTWTPNIEGACGEKAVAKHLGVYWTEIVGDSKADDVAKYQVRTNISRRLNDLCLRPRDPPSPIRPQDRVYISVLSFLPEFVICGWILGSEGKQEQWLREGSPGRPPCYYVPCSALNPLATLPEL